EFTMSLIPQASVRRAKMTANTPKTAPAATATAPLAMLVTFWVTSALASSISSRTSTVIRSETSVTARAKFSPLRAFPLRLPFLLATTPEEFREQEASGKGAGHDQLGAVARDCGRVWPGRCLPGHGRGRGWCLGRRRGGCLGRGRRRCLGLEGGDRRRGLGRRHGFRLGRRGGRRDVADPRLVAHSGGSSSNRRFQIRAETREARSVASAPVAATRPDQ